MLYAGAERCCCSNFGMQCTEEDIRERRSHSERNDCNAAAVVTETANTVKSNDSTYCNAIRKQSHEVITGMNLGQDWCTDLVAGSCDSCAAEYINKYLSFKGNRGDGNHVA